MSPPPAPAPSTRLIVFTRCPLPGTAKTRLTPAVSPVRAAWLQKRMTERTVRVVLQAAGRIGAQPEVRYAGGDLRRMVRWLGGGGRVRTFVPQGGGDLGARMHRAAARAFADGLQRVVIVGSDCPALQPTDLAAAARALDDRDVAIGPSRDGGYWLIALRRPAGGLFRNIAWSTSAVLSQTLDRARQAGLSVALLDERDDVDTPADLAGLSAELTRRLHAPWVSAIVPALNEAQALPRTLERLGSPGVERIVADGGSSDATVDVAREAGAVSIRSPRGRARQINAAAGAAHGDVFVLCHADTLLPRDYVAEIFDALLDPAVAGGAFTFRTDDDTPAMRRIERLVDFRSRQLRLPYGDQGLFVRREAFERVGGMPDVPVAEDLRFVLRLRKLGRIDVRDAPAVTSARRWRRLGVVRTTLVNQTIVVGCLLGASEEWMAKLHARG